MPSNYILTGIFAILIFSLLSFLKKVFSFPYENPLFAFIFILLVGLFAWFLNRLTNPQNQRVNLKEVIASLLVAVLIALYVYRR
ncbi:hypothetical protein ACFOU2_21875 [Bacillus songklensis]|uniref:Uncharacterized protein n=1 Tax=Bacillus songklensis TaxID=1069116 RepID=A0ABV8B9H0_9BACI